MMLDINDKESCDEYYFSAKISHVDKSWCRSMAIFLANCYHIRRYQKM